MSVVFLRTVAILIKILPRFLLVAGIYEGQGYQEIHRPHRQAARVDLDAGSENDGGDPQLQEPTAHRTRHNAGDVPAAWQRPQRDKGNYQHIAFRHTIMHISPKQATV